MSMGGSKAKTRGPTISRVSHMAEASAGSERFLPRARALRDAVVSSLHPTLTRVLSSPALLALVSYVFTAIHSLRNEQHKQIVERVSNQLKDLYGPLLSCVTASKSSYNAMIKQFQESSGRTNSTGALSPAAFKNAVRRDPQGPEAVAYRAWVKSVLMPLSVKAANLVIERADLLEGDQINPILLQLVAHVSA